MLQGADELSRLLNSSCPGVVKRRWKPHLEYVLYPSREAADLAELDGKGNF